MNFWVEWDSLHIAPFLTRWKSLDILKWHFLAGRSNWLILHKIELALSQYDPQTRTNIFHQNINMTEFLSTNSDVSFTHFHLFTEFVFCFTASHSCSCDTFSVWPACIYEQLLCHVMTLISFDLLPLRSNKRRCLSHRNCYRVSLFSP